MSTELNIICDLWLQFSSHLRGRLTPHHSIIVRCFLYHCSYCTLSPLDVIWCGFFCMMCRDVRIKEIVDELCIWLDQLGTILGGNLPGCWQEQTATAFNFYLFIYSSTELTLSQYIWYWLMSPKNNTIISKTTNFLATQKKQFSVHRNLSSFILKKER